MDLNDRFAAIAAFVSAVEIDEAVFSIGKTRGVAEDDGADLVEITDDLACGCKFHSVVLWKALVRP